MRKKEKIKFVEKLGEDTARQITDAIRQGKIPEDWDGFELRKLFEEHAVSVYKMDRARKMRYNNVVNSWYEL